METKKRISFILGLMLIPSFLFAQGIIVSSNAYVIANSGYVVVTGNMANSGTLNLQTGSFTLSGNYTNSGTYTQGTGSIVFNGQSQVLTDNGFGTVFTNVFFSGIGGSGNPAVMSSGNFSVSSIGILSMVNAASLNANGNLTLNSAAASSATVTAIPSSASITGNVNVQRYITGGALNYRGYRLLSSAVYAATSGSNNIFSINYLKNSIYLTGTSTTGGMDNVSPANPTLYLYRENMTPLYSTFLNSNFRGINNINSSPTFGMDDATYPTATIEAGNGFLCFFRGNRTSAAFGAETVPSYVPQTVTLSASGTLNQGAVTVTPWFASGNSLSYTASSPAPIRGYNLVGNPYASSIDWDQFSNSSSSANIYGPNVGTTMYILDPVSDNYGAYQAGSGGVGSNHATNIIPSGLGFFVLAGSTSAKLTFNEGAKTNTQTSGANLLMGKPVNTVNNQYMRLQLALDSVNTEDILLRFTSSSTTAYDSTTDARYLQGYGKVNLASISSDNVNVAIKWLPLPKTSETMGLKINVKADGIYSLNMKSLTGIPQLFDVWLMDAYKKDSLDMRNNPTYSFNVYAKDTASFGSKRFSLVIRQNPAYAYRLLDFTATKVANANQAQLVWKTENEQNYTRFTVERSIDGGKTFDVVGGVAATDQGTYGLLDKTPAAGPNFYRLEQEDINNTITYSAVVEVMFSNTSDLATSNLSIFPNPAKSVINLTITPQLKFAASYYISVTSMAGLIVKHGVTAQPNWQASVSDLEPGTYLVNVFDNSNMSFIGRATLVKL